MMLTKRRLSYLMLTVVIIVTATCVFGYFTGGESTELTSIHNDSEVEFADLYNSSEFTYLYVWTSWCGGCISTLKQSMPTMKSKLDTSNLNIEVKTILVSNVVNSKLKELCVNNADYGVESYHLRTLWPSGLQKLDINQVLNKELKGYATQNSVPVKLLINSKGEVLAQDLFFAKDILSAARKSK